MDIAIKLLFGLGFFSGFIGALFLIIVLSRKSLYFPPEIQVEAHKKTSAFFGVSGIFAIVCYTCILGGKKMIKSDFLTSLDNNKIISVEADGVFFSQYDIKDVFTKFKVSEGRNRCENFDGIITLDNNTFIPIKIIRNCHRKKIYTIISKKYYMDAEIGDITTSEFDYIQKDSISQ